MTHREASPYYAARSQFYEPDSRRSGVRLNRRERSARRIRQSESRTRRSADGPDDLSNRIRTRVRISNGSSRRLSGNLFALRTQVAVAEMHRAGEDTAPPAAVRCGAVARGASGTDAHSADPWRRCVISRRCARSARTASRCSSGTSQMRRLRTIVAAVHCSTSKPIHCASVDIRGTTTLAIGTILRSSVIGRTRPANAASTARLRHADPGAGQTS